MRLLALDRDSRSRVRPVSRPGLRAGPRGGWLVAGRRGDRARRRLAGSGSSSGPASSTPSSSSASSCPAGSSTCSAGAPGDLVFDFDDAVLYRDSYDPRGPHLPAARCGGSAGPSRPPTSSIAGNDFLADCALRIGARAEHVQRHPDLHRRPNDYPLASILDPTATGSTWPGSARRAPSPAWKTPTTSGNGSAAEVVGSGSG